MSKIEEVARAIEPDIWAIFDQCMEGETPEHVAKERGEWESIKHSLETARAALLAIREPDEGMVRAGSEKSNFGAFGAEGMWRAMIDHALTQEGGTIPKPRYATFEDWFYEQEGYGLRAERFDAKSSINWLRAAWQAALTQETSE